MHDIHTHLYASEYDADRDAVIARAHAAGIEGMFVIGCTVEESRQCVALAGECPEIFAAVGIHPHEFSEQESWRKEKLSESIEELRQLARGSKKVIAIGECGLDYYVRPTMTDPKQSFVGRGVITISDETKVVQREGFLAQITLARELKLPLIVHCRDAYEDILDILVHEAMGVEAVILHCYMGDTAVTEKFLELENVYFSFAGNITYPVKKAIVGTKDDLTATVKQVPLDRLFVETDCPFLAPQSVRGERNEPARVLLVAEAVARLKGIRREAVTETIEANFQRIFGKLVVPL